MSIPPPVPANTLETISEMFDAGYVKYPGTPFWDGNDVWDVVKGTHVLWQRITTGKNGGERTEYFHGEVFGWENESVIISSDAIPGRQCYQTVHYRYLVGDPEREWCIVAGGRCYRSSDFWASLLKKLKCPVCDRQFDTESAYECHYHSVHASVQSYQ